MPYKDETKRKEADRERQRKHREGVTDGCDKGVGVTEASLSEGVTEVEGMSHPDVTPLPPGWQHVMDFIKRESNTSMSNLEKLQRTAGSLGKNAGEVRFGLSGPTFEEIGKVIGALAPLHGK